MKQRIRLSESDLHRMIKESVRTILSEDSYRKAAKRGDRTDWGNRRELQARKLNGDKTAASRFHKYTKKYNLDKTATNANAVCRWEDGMDGEGKIVAQPQPTPQSYLDEMIKESVRQVLRENVEKFSYIDKEAFYDDVVEILEEECEKYRQNGYDGDYDYYIENYAQFFCDSMVDDLKKYIESGNYNMSGNFADIKRNYEHDHQGTSFNDVVQMIQNGENNELTDEFKQWTISWIWYAFGTFGLKYNFSNYIDDVMTDWEDED